MNATGRCEKAKTKKEANIKSTATSLGAPCLYWLPTEVASQCLNSYSINTLLPVCCFYLFFSATLLESKTAEPFISMQLPTQHIRQKSFDFCINGPIEHAQ